MFKSPKRFDFIKNFVEIFSAKLVDKVFFLPEKALVWAWGGMMICPFTKIVPRNANFTVFIRRPPQCERLGVSSRCKVCDAASKGGKGQPIELRSDGSA